MEKEPESGPISESLVLSPPPPSSSSSLSPSPSEEINENQEEAEKPQTGIKRSSDEMSLPLATEQTPSKPSPKPSSQRGRKSAAAAASVSQSPPEPGSPEDFSNKKRRGNLPKAATNMLKAWLFNHIFHPYPTEEEKAALSSQTGLSVNQISNWFINARRRILQPMLESARSKEGTADGMPQMVVGQSPGMTPPKATKESSKAQSAQQQQQQQQQQPSAVDQYGRGIPHPVYPYNHNGYQMPPYMMHPQMHQIPPGLFISSPNFMNNPYPYRMNEATYQGNPIPNGPPQISNQYPTHIQQQLQNVNFQGYDQSPHHSGHNSPPI